MLTSFPTIRCPSILSLTVRRSSGRVALVVTSSPTLARAVSSYLHESDHRLTVIWIPSLAAASRHLEGVHASMVVVDETIAHSSDAVDALDAADPEAEVRLLADGLGGS